MEEEDEAFSYVTQKYEMSLRQ